MTRKGQGKPRNQSLPNVSTGSAVTFDCPSCGAPVYVQGDTNAVRCEYCGNNNMVPANLRPPTPSPPQNGPQVVIYGGSLFGKQPIVVGTSNGEIRQGMGCARSIGIFALVLTVASIIASIGFGSWFALNEIPSKFSFSMPTIPVATPTPEYAHKALSFGGRGRGPGLFTDAIDLTSDGAGDIYVLEGNTGRVQRFDREGKYLNGWVVEDVSPSAIVANRQTNAVYVVGKPKIFKYDGPTGNLLGVPLEKGSGFSPTEDAAIFPNGDLLTYVSGDGDALVRLDADGHEVSRFPKVFSNLLGKKTVPPAPWNIRLAADGQERMLALHKPDMEVFIFGPDGKYITRFSDGSERYSFASDIAADSKGRIYVSHLQGILVYDYAGHILADVSYSPGNSVKAMEVTKDDELLALFGSGEVVKLVLPER